MFCRAVEPPAVTDPLTHLKAYEMVVLPVGVAAAGVVGALVLPPLVSVPQAEIRTLSIARAHNTKAMLDFFNIKSPIALLLSFVKNKLFWMPVRLVYLCRFIHI